MNKQIELLRNKLEKLIVQKGNLVDSEVVLLSQELDKFIVRHHSCEALEN